MTTIAHKHLDVAKITDDILNREGAQGWRLAWAAEMVSHTPVEGSALIGDMFPFVRVWFWREEGA